jgi:hypothetical protein
LACLSGSADLFGPVCLPASGLFGFQVSNKIELLTTLTLEKAIAAPAITGLSNPKAANGIPMQL